MPTQDTLRAWQTAERHLEQKQFDSARAAYGRLAGDAELAPMAHLRLSLIARSEGRYRDSVDEALAAYVARVADPDLLELVAKRLFVVGEHEKAVDTATSPTVLGTCEASTLAELGKMLSDHTFPEQALQLLEGAQRLGLRSPALRYLIGLNLNYAGRPAEAQSVLEGCLANAPGMATALWVLAKMGRPPGDGVDRVDRLRAAIAQQPDGDPDSSWLYYALFVELDRRGDTDAAWRALDAGMRARRALLAQDTSGEQALFDHLGELRATPGSGYITDGPRPVFIVGMPRSGTTLLERILGNHPDITDAGELLDLVRQLRYCADLGGDQLLDLELARKAEQFVDWADLGRLYLSHTQWRAKGRAVYTDKLPPNFMNVAYIVRAMPQARILHMVRSPMDTCFSNLKMHFAGVYPPSYDQLEMADHFRRYRTLMAQWHAAFPDKILDVRYDELVADPERVAAEVMEFIGLPRREGLSRIESRAGIVATASATQVREPVHSRFLDQWKRYEPYLGPMKQRLGVLGY